MATTKWAIIGALSPTYDFGAASRANTSGALSFWRDNIVSYAFNAPKFDTQVEALDYFIGLALEDVNNFYWPAYVSGITRLSYPIATGDSISIYLPDSSPPLAEYDLTLTAYAYSFTIFRDGTPGSPDLFVQNFIVANVIADDDVIDPPVGPPPDETIQLKLEASLFSVKPSDATVLPKYSNPVRQIRAQFDTTRIAIIDQALGGGFLIYEEVAGDPAGNIYVYSYDRRLIAVVAADQLAQFLAP